MGSSVFYRWRCDRCDRAVETTTPHGPPEWRYLRLGADLSIPHPSNPDEDHALLCAWCAGKVAAWLEANDGLDVDGRPEHEADGMARVVFADGTTAAYVHRTRPVSILSGRLHEEEKPERPVWEQVNPDAKVLVGFEADPIPGSHDAALGHLIDEWGALGTVLKVVGTVRPAQRLDVLQAAMKRVLGRVEPIEMQDAVDPAVVCSCRLNNGRPVIDPTCPQHGDRGEWPMSSAFGPS